ncbi:MAG: hypothetical protein ACI4QT_00405 [Kiritimatiellia bacterium]
MYITVGTIKTIDLSNHTFTLEPIAGYRFQVKDGDENSWKIIFKEDGDNPTALMLIEQGAKFAFNAELTSGLILLKQNRTRISVTVETTKVSQKDVAPKPENGITRKIANAINDSAPVEIEIQ